MDNDYQSYSLEELASDTHFRDWVLNPNPENIAFWQEFLAKYPEKETLILDAKTLVSGVHTYFNRKATDTKQLDRYFEEVLHRSESVPVLSPSWGIRSLTYRRLTAAASIVLVLGIIGWLWISQAQKYQTYATAYGEWKTVELSDGSTVRLNAHSEIRLARDWEAGSDRKVWLKGEAFFEVAKKPATGAKFYVITQDVSVEVLGTSFNVNNRGEKTEVFLEEGRIKLEAGQKEAYMEPGDFIAYSAAKQQIIENRKAADELHSSWKDGVLILEDKSTAEILEKLEDIYGVTFRLENRQLMELKTTIRIPMDKLEIALPILEKALGAQIKQAGNHWIVQ